MKKTLIRILIGIVALAVVVLASSIFFLGRIVKKGIETVGPRATQVEVKLDSAVVWLLPGRVQLTGLSVGNPPGCKTPVSIKTGDIEVRLNTKSALSHKIIVDSVTVKSLEITLEGGLKKNNLTQIEKNVSDYVGSQTDLSQTEAKPATSPPAAGKPGRKFQINELVITGVRLHVASLFATGVGVTISLPDIRIADLGADQAGITSPEVAQKVLRSLLSSIATNAPDALGKLGQDAGKAFDFKKAGEKLKNMFKK
jgi:hypothetical protein